MTDRLHLADLLGLSAREVTSALFLERTSGAHYARQFVARRRAMRQKRDKPKAEEPMPDKWRGTSLWWRWFSSGATRE